MTTQQHTFSVSEWLTGRLPSDWFTEVAVTIDRDEILVTGTITAPEVGESEDSQRGRIQRFREDTRAKRMEIAQELQSQTERKVSWAATCGTTTVVFTRVSAPVMTRLIQPQRKVLDTLVEAGVARSRSDALAWCVRLVEQHESDWLSELEAAMGAVRAARDKGPTT